jgi:uncharacterized UPF0160 family protein
MYVMTHPTEILALAPIRNRFDHHQRGFTETFDSQHRTKLSSAGLIYKHFGKDILAKVSTVALDGATVELLYNKVYDVWGHNWRCNVGMISMWKRNEP